MAEIIGLAASIVAIVELSAKVTSLCVKYYSKVKNAVDDIGRLQLEADGLSNTLKHVQQLLDSPNGEKLKASQNLHSALDDCRRKLAELVKRLEPGKTHKAMNRVGIGALTWPFNSTEVEDIVKNLVRCRDLISLGLQVDHT
jgi:FtsZ-binding cell division protein ZapB